MAAVRGCVACISVVLIIFTVLSNAVIQKWLLHKIYSIKSVGSYTTSNKTSMASNTTSAVSPTSACSNQSYHKQYRKATQSTNVTLYVIPKFPTRGRLGNQMFQYAALLGIAQTQGRQMLYDPNADLVKTFKVTHVGVIASSEKWQVTENHSFFDEELMNLPMNNMRIGGYLQSLCYFITISDEIRQEFTFHDSIANAAANILHDLKVTYNSSTIVGVHVRRGDFLSKPLAQLGFGVPGQSYFMKAFSVMKSKFPVRNITFLIASDDLPWCRTNLLGSEVSIMPNASAAVHLAVLSKCDHVIISGGTFGWWGGWLANGYVIYYTGYMRRGTPFGDRFRHDQYYPSMWLGLGD